RDRAAGRAACRGAGRAWPAARADPRAGRGHRPPPGPPDGEVPQHPGHDRRGRAVARAVRHRGRHDPAVPRDPRPRGRRRQPAGRRHRQGAGVHRHRHDRRDPGADVPPLLPRPHRRVHRGHGARGDPPDRRARQPALIPADAHPRLPRRRQSTDRPRAVDRRGGGPVRVLGAHLHLRDPVGAQAAAAARARRGRRDRHRAAGDPGQCRRPLFRRRPRGPAQRRGHAQAHHPRSRRRPARPQRAAARRCPDPAPGGGDRLRRARPARLPRDRHRHRAGAARGGAGAMNAPGAERAQGAWPIYRRLLGYAGRYWPLLAASGVAMIVEALAGAGFVKLMDPLVNRGFVDPDPKMAVLLPLAIIVLFVVRSLATYVTDYGMARTGRSVVRDLREEVLGKYLRLPSSHFDTESVPSMVSRLNFDTEQVTQAGTDAAKAIITDGLTIAFLLGIMVYTSLKVTFAMLLITPLIGVLVWYVGKRYRRISRGIQEGMGHLAQSAEQSLAAQQD